MSDSKSFKDIYSMFTSARTGEKKDEVLLADIPKFVTEIEKQEFTVGKNYGFADLKFNSKVTFKSITNDKGKSYDYAMEHIAIYFDMVYKQGSYKVCLKFAWNQEKKTFKHLTSDRMYSLIKNTKDLEKILKLHKKELKNIKLNSCLVVYCDGIAFWVEKLLDNFRPFRLTSKDFIKEVCLTHTDQELLATLQSVVAHHSDPKKKRTVCDLQGNLEDKVYTLSDIEFTDTLWPKRDLFTFWVDDKGWKKVCKSHKSQFDHVHFDQSPFPFSGSRKRKLETDDED